MRGVALFDIDGTLTATNEVDRDCFLAAFLQEFAITEIDSDWLGYEQTTDRGITADQAKALVAFMKSQKH